MKAVACRVHRLDARTTGTFEPDTAILAALEKLQPNEHFCVQFDREPFALYRCCPTIHTRIAPARRPARCTKWQSGIAAPDLGWCRHF